MTSYLLNQDGDNLLFQDGGQVILTSAVYKEEMKVVVKDGDGESLGEFDVYNNLKFGKRLNDYGEASLSIPLNNSKLSTLLSLRENSIYIYDKFYFESGPPYLDLVWSGEQAKTDAKLESNADNWLTLYCYTWFERFTQRVTSFERVYTDTDAGQIAWSLIDESQRGVKNTGYHLPNVSHSGGSFQIPNNAFTENETFSYTSILNLAGIKQYWRDYNLNIPTGSTIDGIEITVKGKAEEEDTAVQVGVKSDSAGAENGETVTLTTSNAFYTIGGPTELFGLTWAAEDFDDANPLTYVKTLANYDLIYIDVIKIKVYYTVNDSMYDFGITQGSIEETTTRDRTYNNDVIANKIMDLANVNSGFDFEITDEKVFNVYSTQGQDFSESVVLEYGRNVKSVRVIEDFINPVNKAIVIGSAYGEDDIQRVEVDDETSQTTYKVREKIYTEMDEVDTLNFTDRGQAMLDKFGQRLLSVDVDLVQSSIPLSQFQVGNEVTLIIRNNYFNINATYRIFEITVEMLDNNAKRLTVLLGNYSL